MLAELGEVPTGAAEDADLHAGDDNVVDVAGHGADEGGFSAAVGAEDGNVLACADGEVDVVQDEAVAEGDVDLAHVEEDACIGGWCGVWAGQGIGSHLIC